VGFGLYCLFTLLAIQCTAFLLGYKKCIIFYDDDDDDDDVLLFRHYGRYNSTAFVKRCVGLSAICAVNVCNRTDFQRPHTS